MEWFENNNLNNEKKQFLDISFQSNKWKKWIIPHSEITNLEKAIISGHYVLSDLRINSILNKLNKSDEKNNLQNYVKNKLDENHLRYMKCLNLI